MAEKVQLDEKQWQDRLTPEQYQVLRKGGTEPPFMNMYVHEKRDGVYHCAGCGTPLFSSKTKYESGTGWPSFWEPIHPDAVYYKQDRSFGMVRTEVLCSTCDGHLGHLFDDGPQPTGQRYCMNSAAMTLEPEDDDSQ